MFDDILGEYKKGIKSDFYVDKNTGKLKRWVIEYGEIIEQANNYNQLYPDPTPEELNLPEFNAVWDVIKSWDICDDGSGIYHRACGNNVKAILDVLGIGVLRMYVNHSGGRRFK